MCVGVGVGTEGEEEKGEQNRSVLDTWKGVEVPSNSGRASLIDTLCSMPFDSIPTLPPAASHRALGLVQVHPGLRLRRDRRRTRHSPRHGEVTDAHGTQETA